MPCYNESGKGRESVQISIDDRKLLWLALFVVAILLRQSLVAALLPFFLAVCLAAILEPAVNLLEQRGRLPRSLSTILILFAVVSAGGYITLLVATKVLSELVQMGTLLQRYQHVPVDLATKVIEDLNRLNEIVDQRQLPQAVQDNILQAVDDIANAGVGLITQGINLTLNAASKVPSLIVILVIALIGAYFMLKDRDRLVESTLAAVPAGVREKTRDLQQRIVVDLVGFIKAQFILLTLTTVVIGVGLIAIGINYWMTLAIVAGVLDIIPVLGPGFLLIPWAIGAWTLGQTALATKLILLFGLSFFLRQLFQAKILGDFIGVHPLPMLLALYAGIHFFGIQGIIVAPVLVIIAKALYAITKRP